MSDAMQNTLPENLLREKLRIAFQQKDETQVKALLQAKGVPDRVKANALIVAVESGALNVVRFLCEEQKIELSPEGAMMLLLSACVRQEQETALYLCEAVASTGQPRSDAYALLFEKFAPSRHDDLIGDILRTTPDRQDALDNMLYAAASARSLDILPRLMEDGAKTGTRTHDILLFLCDAHATPFFQKKNDYLSLLDTCLATADTSFLDALLAVAAAKALTGTQYPETLDLLLAHGADPFLTSPTSRAAWRDFFDPAETTHTQRAKDLFSALFGDDFRIADLRQPLDEHGGNGFTLAARARRLDKVLETAEKEGAGTLAADDLTQQDGRGRSALSLAVSRGDVAMIVSPSYWQKKDPDILQKLASALDEKQKQSVDFSGLSAKMLQFRLHSAAGEERPRPQKRNLGPGKT